MMHNKVLLIYEDYSELNSVQSTLKKVGFDCVGISSEFSTSEQVLSFNPDIVIANGKGPKVSTTGVGRRLKDMHRWNGKTILIFPPGVKPKPQDLIKIRMDVVLEAPVQLVRLIQVLANLTNQDDQILIEKLVKQTAAKEDQQKKEDSFSLGKKAAEDNIYISGSSGKKEEEKSGNIKSRKDGGKFGKLSGTNEGDNGEAFWTRGGDGGDDKKKASGFVTRDSDRSTPSSKARFDLNPQTSSKGPLDKSESIENKNASEADGENEKVDWSQVENELLNPGANEEKKENEIFFATGGEPEVDNSVEHVSAEVDLSTAIEQAEREAQRASLTATEAVIENGTETVIETETETEAAAETETETEAAAETEIEAKTETETETETVTDAEPDPMAAPEVAPVQLKELGLSGLDAPADEGADSQSQSDDVVVVSGDLSQPEDPEVQARHNELLAAESQLGEKLKRYTEMTQSLTLAPESTLKRTVVRKAQKELKKDWSNDELHSQDDLRREFTKALFRKN